MLTMLGRPTICTPEVIEAVREAMEMGATQTIAQDYAGISSTAWHEWMAKGATGQQPYADFAAAVKASKGKGAIRNLGIIKDAAPNDWKAAAWMLERVHNYWKGEHVKHTGLPVAAPEPTMTDAEVAEAVEAELATFPVEVLAMALAEAQRRTGEVGEAK